MSQCTQCGSWQSQVKESRRDTRFGWKWRLRDCISCDNRWSTYEMPVENVTVDGMGDPNGKLER
jgi:transcriptional regulator NrdR family protein